MPKPTRNTGQREITMKRPVKDSDVEAGPITGRSIYKGDVADKGLEDPRHWLDVSEGKPDHALELEPLEGPTEASEPDQR